ncbi:MAG: UvrD-helicase domain-containing protein [Candidatus Omnitrophota bacterium]
MKDKNPSNPLQPRVYATDASAGSGKTYALATHYIRLLLDNSSIPRQIENILAITFTNKAAREMKERILELLKKIALDKFTDPTEEARLLSGLSIDKKKACVKASELMDYIIQNYNYFQVKTIDSFINMILLGCAYRLNLSANFKIKDNRQDYLAYSVDECIDRAGYDKQVRKAFDNFLKQYIYLKERSSWFPKADILGLMGSLFYYSNIYGAGFKKFDLKGEDIFKGKQEVLKLYRSLYEKLPDNVHGRFRNLIRDFLGEHKEAFDFAEITSKKTLMQETVPVTKGSPVVPAAIEKLWSRIRQRNSELAEEEALSLFNCYIDIFDLVYEVFRKAASRDDVLFLEELNQQAYSLISENGITVPELYYQLAIRLRHFLIDEFQDTSVLQWRNLFPMIEETLSTGGSFFYVGDKKQAIFRFRGGEASLFNSIKKDFAAYVSGDSLKTNYRSQKEIVEFNNAVFGKENLEKFLAAQQPEDNQLKRFNQDDIKEIVEVFSGSRQEYKKDGKHEDGYVNIGLIEAADKELRDERIRERLLSLMDDFKQEARFSLRDIAVLCRDNSEVELVSGWLIEGNIPVESDKTLNIKNNILIKELTAFLMFLNSPIDNLSFSSFILGDMFLKASGMDIERIEDFLFEIKEKLSRDQGCYIYREFKKAFPDAWDNFIEPFFKRIGFVGLYELTIDIYKKFGVFRHFPGQQGFFMHFLQLIKDSEEECQGISDFLEYFQALDNYRLYVNSSDTEAVKVTTIHKAKGLGFGTVVIPFFELDINYLGERDMKTKVSYTIERTGQGISLLRLDKKYALLSSRIYEAYTREYKKAFIDELNTLYVSLTRAKNELYVFIPFGMERANNIARLLIPEERLKQGSKRSYVSLPIRDVSSLFIEPPEYRDWNSLLKDEFQDIDTVKNRRNVMRGEALHGILASIGNLTQEDKEKSIEEGLGKARSLFPSFEDWPGLERIVRNLLAQEAAGRFFYVTDGLVYREKDVIDRFGITKRIDRLIIKETEIWIIDYKTKQEGAADYKEQLGAYKGIIKEIYPGKTVKCYLVFLEEAKVEEING